MEKRRSQMRLWSWDKEHADSSGIQALYLLVVGGERKERIKKVKKGKQIKR